MATTMLSITLLLATYGPQQPIPLTQHNLPESPSPVFTRVERVGDNSRAFFLISAAGRNYTIRSDGYGEIEAAKTLRRKFQLPLGQPGRLSRLYFAEYENDLLFIYEVTNGEYGWGFVERFDPKNQAAKWRKPLSGFNLGPALIESHYAYLSAFFVLAKIDLNSGAFVWQQEEFKREYAPMVEFFLPSLREERVIFPVDERVIEVDKNNGKVLAIHDAQTPTI